MPYGIRSMLIRHEGLRLKPYRDFAVRFYAASLDKDILRARAAAATFSWYPKLDAARKDVIVNMVFNLGLSKFSEFRRMIAALDRGDFQSAASEMLASKWSAQVKSRAVELATMMRSGQYLEE